MPNLRPATREEMLNSLSYALRFDNRGKSHHRYRELAAQLAAETIVSMLERHGYVVMKDMSRMPQAPSAGGWAEGD